MREIQPLEARLERLEFREAELTLSTKYLSLPAQQTDVDIHRYVPLSTLRLPSHC